MSLNATNDRFYIPSLDGLRAVAFMAVFLGHAGLANIVPGGFGVTTFFFLSGYLITTLLRREFVLTGHVSLRRFYMRRILRIFPPLYLSLAIMLAMTIVGLLPGQLNIWAVLSQSAFLTNYYSLYGAHPAGVPSGSDILWSLAVEEHFYLAFPALFLVISVWRPKSQALILLAICGVFLAWRIFLISDLNAPFWRIYVATDTRMDSLLFGCTLGLFLNPCLDETIKLNGISRVAAYCLPLALLLFSFLYRDEIFRSTYRYTIQGIALLPLFYLAITEWQLPWFAWLNLGPVRFLGTLSYTAYLIHFSIISSLRWELPSANKVEIGILAFVLTIIFATGMYLLVERPCASMRRKLRN